MSSNQDVASTVLAKAERVRYLKQSYSKMNELCRGGGGSEAVTMDACDAREKIDGQLQKMGYCYGSYDAENLPESDRTYDFYACETLRSARTN
jgi:hypothetical protein